MKRWQTLELPILPFLAPRVFAPWPSRYTQQRVNSRFHTVQRPDIAGVNAHRLERKEAAIKKWLQKKRVSAPYLEKVNNEEQNIRAMRLGTSLLGSNYVQGVESLTLQRHSVRGRYLRQHRPPVRKVLSNRGIALHPSPKRSVSRKKTKKYMNLSNPVKSTDLLTTNTFRKSIRPRGLVQRFMASMKELEYSVLQKEPKRSRRTGQKCSASIKEGNKRPIIPQKKPETPQRLIRPYLSSVKEELKLPIALPSFLKTRLYIRTVPTTPRPVIKKKFATDHKSRIMFNTYFADQLTKRTISKSRRRRSNLIAKMKKSISKRKLIGRDISNSAQGRGIRHTHSSKMKPRKVESFDWPKILRSQIHDLSLSGKSRKGKKRRRKKPQVQEPLKASGQEEQPRSVERKNFGVLLPRKMRRHVAQTSVKNALEARRKELKRLQNFRSRRPLYKPHVTSWRQAWHRRFSLLQSNHTGFMKAWIGSPRKTQKFPIYKNSLPMRFKGYMAHLKSSRQLRAFWEQVPEQIRVKYWHDIMCFTLQRHPKSGLKLLVATYITPFPAGYAVGNCLDYIISYYLTPFVKTESKSKDSTKQSYLEIHAPINWAAYEKRSPLPRQPLAESPNPLVLSNLAAAVVFLSQNGPRDVQINRGSQYLLVRTLNIDHLESIYRNIPKYWSVDHLFTIADRFAKAKKSALVLEVLGRLEAHPGVNFDSQQMHMLFSTLLRFDNRDNANSYSDAMMWDHMTSRGLKPIAQHYNILIQNSFLRGESNTCWAIYNAMLEDGVSPDHFTHSTLLTYSKSLMDKASVHRTLALAKAMNLQMNPFIATDHLHSIFLFYRQDYESDSYGENLSPKGPPKAFEQMLPVYCRYFDPRPLAMSIGPLAEQYPELSQPPPESTKLMEPPKQALTVMFMGLLYGFTEASQVIEAYSYFRSLLSHGEPDLVARLHQSHIYDCFLMKFGKLPETVDKCPKVVEDMLTSSKTKLALISRHENEDFYLNLVPTIYTWNILLQVYASRGQMNAGRRVLEIMQERGIEPTTVTWGTLATGYSWVQDIPGTLEAVDQLTKLGVKDHPVGVHALNKIRDTRTLYAIMEAREAKHKVDRVSDEDDKAMKIENKSAEMDETRTEELVTKRIQLIGEAIQDMERGSWQKRRYWENVFRESSAAREAAGIQPLIPDSALDGSHVPYRTVLAAPMSEEEQGDKIVNWSTLWNETIGAHDFRETFSLMKSVAIPQKEAENGPILWRRVVDEERRPTLNSATMLEQGNEERLK